MNLKKKFPPWINIENIILWGSVLTILFAGLIFEREEEIRVKEYNLSKVKELALRKSLLEEGINFIEKGECFNFNEDVEKQILFSDEFAKYINKKAESEEGEFPENPVLFNKKLWRKCFGEPELLHIYQYRDGKRYKSKTWRYKSINTSINVNTIKNYIQLYEYEKNKKP